MNRTALERCLRASKRILPESRGARIREPRDFSQQSALQRQETGGLEIAVMSKKLKPVVECSPDCGASSPYA